MNYEKIYESLIHKRRLIPYNKTKNCYCEYHHIIPTSLGGENTPRRKCFNIEGTNLIGLTAKEHYIAHLLLVKIVETKYGKESDSYAKMVRAVTYFKTCINNKTLTNRNVLNFNSRIFSHIRAEYAKIESKRKIGLLVGERNGMYGRKRTPEEKQKISETRIKFGLSKGKNNPMYGVSLNDILTPEKIKLWHQHQSEKLKGEKNPCYGRKWMHIKGSSKKEDRIYVKKSQCQYYLNLGYVFGMKN